nr:hypothetical protein [Tanacetum cinerariifolium]
MGGFRSSCLNVGVPPCKSIFLQSTRSKFNLACYCTVAYAENRLHLFEPLTESNNSLGAFEVQVSILGSLDRCINEQLAQAYPFLNWALVTKVFVSRVEVVMTGLDLVGSYEYYKGVGAEVELLEPGFELQGSKMVEMGQFG